MNSSAIGPSAALSTSSRRGSTTADPSLLPPGLARLGRAAGPQLVQILLDLLFGQALQALLRRQGVQDLPTLLRLEQPEDFPKPFGRQVLQGVAPLLRRQRLQDFPALLRRELREVFLDV